VHPRGDEREYVRQNELAWESWAPWYAARGRAAWDEEQLTWGNWAVAESDVELLEGVAPGADVIELGCGTGVICAWLTRLGYRAVGVDIARAQLETAAQLQTEFGLRFSLLHANAESLNYADDSFDCAISEYGASLWCDPRNWLPEAARVLRPAGRLVFVINSPMLMAATPTDGSPAGDRLVRDYFAERRVVFEGDGAIEFHATHSEWLQMLRAEGLVLEKVIETRPQPHAKPRFEFASVHWARRWPSEEIWIARKQV
jgi:SAM-dependent methyltransferase